MSRRSLRDDRAGIPAVSNVLAPRAAPSLIRRPANFIEGLPQSFHGQLGGVR